MGRGKTEATGREGPSWGGNVDIGFPEVRTGCSRCLRPGKSGMVQYWERPANGIENPLPTAELPFPRQPVLFSTERAYLSSSPSSQSAGGAYCQTSNGAQKQTSIPWLGHFARELDFSEPWFLSL